MNGRTATVSEYIATFNYPGSDLIGRQVLSRKAGETNNIGKIVSISTTRGMEELHIEWEDGAPESCIFVHQCENELISWAIVTESGEVTDDYGSPFISESRDYLDLRIQSMKTYLEQKYKETVSVKPVRLVDNKYWEIIEPFAFDGELTTFVYDL